MAQVGTTAQNLPAGIWAVTVTDASGCSADSSVSISEPFPFNASIGVIRMHSQHQPLLVFQQVSIMLVTDDNGCKDSTSVQIGAPLDQLVASFSVVLIQDFSHWK